MRIDLFQYRWVVPVLLLGEVALLGLIIWRVPYTEIDWKAYMEQVTQYIAGERDYTKIRGGTGPLVYPAAHVYIYRLLYDWTDGGKNVKVAQYIFAGVYLLALSVVMACYRMAKVPIYVLPMLVLSKRLHSIFVLRLFNDCFAVLFLWVAIYCFQKRWWTAGSMVYSIGLGVKMSLLLVVPAIGIILVQAIGARSALRKAGLMAQIQVLIALPFLRKSAGSYFSRAFEFSRQFLFKESVNWKFVGEEVFHSSSFSTALLAAHFSILVLFATTRWLRPSYGLQSIPDLVRSLFKPLTAGAQSAMSRRITSRYILITILSANAIGMLCARSLHFQFYSWITWATPVLLWQSGLHPVLQYVLWGVQEYVWNVYPSNNTTSPVVVFCLAATVALTWVNATPMSGETGAVDETQARSKKTL